MKEEPNTKFYFDEKIARVVFVDDVERKIYWVDMTDFYSNYRPHLHHLGQFRRLYPNRLLPIEEWLKENNMNYVEDDMCLFALTWL